MEGFLIDTLWHPTDQRTDGYLRGKIAGDDITGTTSGEEWHNGDILLEERYFT
jgi:hypothetical protein